MLTVWWHDLEPQIAEKSVARRPACATNARYVTAEQLLGARSGGAFCVYST